MGFPPAMLSSLPSPPQFSPIPSNANSSENYSSRLSESATASWTSSIAHHCRNGRLSNAVSQFHRMQTSGVPPNHVTLVTLLSGCARFPSHGGSSLGQAVHGIVKKLGLDSDNVMVGTAVVDMYARFGKIETARSSFDRMNNRNRITWNTLINGYIKNDNFEEALNLFDEMPERDAVSWTVVIDGFVKKGRFEEALEWFQLMQMFQISPDFVPIISAISAVANSGMLGLGLWLHRFATMNSFTNNVKVNNSLIDMYCRCGSVKFACQLFDKMPKRNIVSWNSIIVGLACNACADKALGYFHSMVNSGFEPDAVTFTGTLTACTHAGLVDKGVEIFKTMTRVYKIVPTIEHYGCIVDLYCRAGRLKEALMMVDTMPVKPNEVVIGSLLAACRAYGGDDSDLADRLMTFVRNLDPSGDFSYVLLSNIYAAKGSWRRASNVRRKMKALGVQKRPGISSIEVNGCVHEFTAGDRSHSDEESIYTMLELLSYDVSMFGHNLEHIEMINV